MKDLGSLGSTQEATPLATLTHLSCSPNFPRASYLDERTLTYEPIVNESGTYRRLIISLNTDCLSVKLCLFPIIAFHLVRTYAIMRILMGVILRLKRSQWAKRLYLLQLKDCHFHNNYKGRKVVSHIYEDSITGWVWWTFCDISRRLSSKIIYLFSCGPVKLFRLSNYSSLFFLAGGEGSRWTMLSVQDSLVQL